jgi:LysM repeat protein
MSANMNNLRLWRIIPVGAALAFTSTGLAVSAKPSTNRIYTVKTGDTFARIAKANDVSITELLTANRIANPDRILLGQRLVIPGQKPVGQPPSEAGGLHQSRQQPPLVKRLPAARVPGVATRHANDDTMHRIERLTGTSLATLRQLNGLTESSNIHPGQSLRIGSIAPATSGAKLPAVRPKEVREGGDRSPLSKREASGTASHGTALAGARAPLPAAPSGATRGGGAPDSAGVAPHTVESGETISSISRLYGLSPAKLTRANPRLDPNRIRAGQVILIPEQPLRPQPAPLMVRADGRILAPRPDPLAPGSEHEGDVAPGRTRTGYLVAEGETIGEIARRFHTTEREIRRLNRMGESDGVYAGRYILVPFIRQAPPNVRYAHRDA